MFGHVLRALPACQCVAPRLHPPQTRASPATGRGSTGFSACFMWSAAVFLADCMNGRAGGREIRGGAQRRARDRVGFAAQRHLHMRLTSSGEEVGYKYLRGPRLTDGRFPLPTNALQALLSSMGGPLCKQPIIASFHRRGPGACAALHASYGQLRAALRPLHAGQPQPHAQSTERRRL